MDITKCLTLSTVHIEKNTSASLDKECNWESGVMRLCVYKKRDFGWWISIPDESDFEDLCQTVPKDLMECLKLAIENDCSLLCLDREGDTVPELDTYRW